MDSIARASRDQSRAADPDSSAWVTANAGSGKTHVLVNRIIRLLLTGTDPQKILCLTFTRAAAAEMSNRLFKRLGEWIPLSDDELITRIHQHTGHVKISKNDLAVPRRLFARALETPGGLKIQTIHAFCEKLLHKFPLEAGVTPGFKVMEDRPASELSMKVRNDYLSTLTDTTQLAQVVKYAGGQQGFDDLISHIFETRENLRPALNDPQAAIARLADLMNLAPGATADTIIDEIVDGVDRIRCQRYQEILAASNVNQDNKQAEHLRLFLISDDKATARAHLQAVLFTADMKIKAQRSFVAKDVNEANPEIRAYFQKQAERIGLLLEREKDVNTLAATRALITIAAELVARYDREKREAGYYDYTDLVARVLAMFADMPDAAWVLYKLDGGIDHILVDEAQDTSNAQWQIIRFLADDFFSGQSARETADRTIFAVGDRKQSIYGFQGAAPRQFDQQQAEISKLAHQVNSGFASVELQVSFRSTGEVLRAVDTVFAQSEAQKGVGATVHEATRSGAGDNGLVELWPVVEVEKAEKSSAWDVHDQARLPADPRVDLAAKIAAKIKSWLDTKTVLESAERLLTPGDILILVRNRTTLMPAIVRALKANDIPVAGVDRLLLTHHIAIEDLLSLARFVLLPEDDLNLACLLKSPLVLPEQFAGLNDDDLIHLAARRGGACLWAQLNKAATENKRYHVACETLQSWRVLAVQLRPYEFFATVLSCNHGRRRLMARLGTEAGEPLDIFLELARDYERMHTPSLQGFVSWISKSDVEIKRESANDAGEVRVMTVHGAKGLESPVVIIADTCQVPDTRQPPKIVFADKQTPVWRLNKNFQAAIAGQLANDHHMANFEEYNRLLYVAMTRARDRLYIAGAHGASKLKDQSWYRLIANRLQQDSHRVDDEVFGHVWRYGDAPACRKITQTAPPNAPDAGQLPNWITGKAAPLRLSDRWLSPSHLGDELEEKPEKHTSALATETDNRFVRGKIIHALLQYLPAIAGHLRHDRAQSYINQHAGELDERTRAETLREVLRVLAHEDFADVFSPHSMAEVPLVGEITLPGGSRKVVNGQIDRLCVTGKDVLIVDYKTNRPPPKDLSGIDKRYIYQLQAYRQVLGELYGGHTIRTALLWTWNATLMEVPAKLLRTV